MSSSVHTFEEGRRTAVRLQIVTVIWMSAEAIVALASAYAARSPALWAFGGDSAIELLSAGVVLWRFRSTDHPRQIERTAARIAGGLLLLLAAYIVAASYSALLGHRQPQPSFLGIAVLLTSSFGMPWLANRKRQLAGQLASPSLKADSTQSALCGYMSWIALAGLLANALLHVSWADPLAALGLVPFVIKEGLEAVRSARSCC